MQISSQLQKYIESKRTFYVSITGLKVKSLWAVLFFVRHAVASKMQADRAPGILFVGTKRISGIQHTLTVWENKADMQSYIYSGAHQKAIRAFRKIATGKTFGFESQKLPTWEETHRLWLEKGQDYES